MRFLQHGPSASSADASSGSTTTAAAGGATSGTSAAGASAGAGGNGQATFNQTCQACHAAGAPKLGDKADWGPRIAQGNDTLYQHALQGFQGKKGVMPPKGGNAALADADVKAAVDYMVAQAK